jgi:hypothetical protein
MAGVLPIQLSGEKLFQLQAREGLADTEKQRETKGKTANRVWRSLGISPLISGA